MLLILFIQQIMGYRPLSAAFLSGIIPNKFDHLFSLCPGIQAGLVLVAKPLLWGHLVFEGAAFPAIGDGRKRPGAEALLFQSKPLPTFLLIPNAGNGWHIMAFQPAIHDFQIHIGVRLLAAGICK